MAALIGYFDAGGSQHDQQFIVVAGFISSSDVWSKFEHAWQARLKRDGISYFHMVECAHSTGQFRSSWKDDERKRRALLLLGDLMDIILSHTFRKFACVIENKKFREIITTEQRKKWRLDGYSWAGLYCAMQVNNWRQLETTFREPPQFVFEDGDLGKGLLEERLTENGFGSPTFRPKMDTKTKNGVLAGFIPLQ
jgi:hypothetical protein